MSFCCIACSVFTVKTAKSVIWQLHPNSMAEISPDLSELHINDINKQSIRVKLYFRAMILILMCSTS